MGKLYPSFENRGAAFFKMVTTDLLNLLINEFFLIKKDHEPRKAAAVLSCAHF